MINVKKYMSFYNIVTVPCDKQCGRNTTKFYIITHSLHLCSTIREMSIAVKVVLVQ